MQAFATRWRSLPWIQNLANHLGVVLQWFLNGPGLAFLFVLVYFLFYLLPFPLLHYYSYAQDTFAKITNRNYGVAFRLTLAALLLVVIYAQMWRTVVAKPTRGLLVATLGGWFVVSLMLVMTDLAQSTDVGDYIFRAHMLVDLHQNPMTVPPSALIQFKEFPYLAWLTVVDPYGPFWEWIAGGLHILAGQDLLANILAFKLLAFVSTGITGVLIWATARQLAPGTGLTALVLWLWNPLVLNEGALHGHNDLVMLVFVAAGFLLVVRNRPAPGILLLIIAALFKVPALLFVPVVMVWLVRRRGIRAALPPIAIGLAVGGVLAYVTYLPFGGVGMAWSVLRDRSWWATGSWVASAFYSLRDTMGVPHPTAVLLSVDVMSLVFFIVYALLLLNVRDLITGAWSAILSYVLIGLHWFQPWYASLLIVFTAMGVNRRLTIYSFIFTWFMLFQPIVSQFFLAPLHLPSNKANFVLASMSLFIPQLLAILLLSKKPIIPPGLSRRWTRRVAE